MKKKKPSKTKKKVVVKGNKDAKLQPTVKFKTLIFEEVKEFIAGQRYLIHLKSGVFKFAIYVDVEYLKKIDSMHHKNISPEEMKDIPQSYFIIEHAVISYCLVEDLHEVYSVGDGKIYHSDNHPNG